MRVMCIKNGEWNHVHCFPEKCPSFGDECTVIGENYSKTAYLLQEFPHPHDPLGGWSKERFIPLSDIDEMELVNQKQEPQHA